MSSKHRPRIWGSIALHLSFLYTMIFAAFFFIVCLTLYWILVSYLYQTKDHWMLEEAHEIQKLLLCSKYTYAQMKKHMEDEAFYGKPQHVFYCLKNQAGQPLVFSNPSHFKDLLHDNQHFPWKRGPAILFETRRHGTRVLRVLYYPLPNGLIVQNTVSLEANELFIRHFVTFFSLAYLAAICISWILGFLMVKSTLRPVHMMTTIARRFSMKNLQQRIPTNNSGNELSVLAATLNSMLTKIERLVQAMKEMNGNLAHDLRTFISRMRLNTEIALMKERSVAEYQDILAESMQEYDIFLSVINTLLDISEVEAGILTIEQKKLDLDDLILKTLEIFGDILEHKNLSLHYVPNGPLLVRGDALKLRQAIINLLDNAIKYTDAGGRIKVTACKQGEHVKVQIEDTGIGIPAECQPHIFKRFYRADKARSLSGSGLGLSLSAAIIEAHHGSIEVQSVVGQGSIFTLRLPIVPSNGVTPEHRCPAKVQGLPSGQMQDEAAS